MSNERPDDFLSWRRTLSQPDALSEHGLEDKEISWEKLAERLREKPRRWTGYWIAAACLLLALVPVARLFRDHPRAESPRPIALHPTALRPVTLPTAALRPAPLRPSAPHPAAHPAAHPVAALPGAHLTTTHHSAPPRPVPLTVDPPTTAAGPLTAALTGLPVPSPPNGPQATPTTPAKQKKQLRIVNINEISKGTNPAPATAGREPGFLRIGTTIPDPPGSSEDNRALLKIKLSQNR